MAAWRRANPSGASTWLGFVFVVVGLAIASMITVVLVVGGGRWEVHPFLGIFYIYGFLGLWTGFAWRIYRTGVYASERGVRVAYPWWNRTIPWQDIAGFTGDHRAMLGNWATARNAIYIKLTDGRLVQTPVQRRVSMFAGGVRLEVGPVLGEAAFDATLAYLRQCLETRSGGQGL